MQRKIDLDKPLVLKVTKASAAESQLETAIELWFNYGDPVSIHSLAVAANDCYNAMGAHAGKPSAVQTWLKGQPESFQKRARLAQNFFKHGRINLKGHVGLSTTLTEVFLFDSVMCHESVFGVMTPLMRSFFIRYIIMYPDTIRKDVGWTFPTGDYADYVARLDRKAFLNELLPQFTALHRQRFGTGHNKISIIK